MDRYTARRRGKPVYADSPRVISNDAQAVLDRPAVLGGGRATATLIRVGPRTAEALDEVRDLLADLAPRLPVRGGAPAITDRLIVRLVAAEGWSSRRSLKPLLEALRGVKRPRVWEV